MDDSCQSPLSTFSQGATSKVKTTIADSPQLSHQDRELGSPNAPNTWELMLLYDLTRVPFLGVGLEQPKPCFQTFVGRRGGTNPSWSHTISQNMSMGSSQNYSVILFVGMDCSAEPKNLGGRLILEVIHMQGAMSFLICCLITPKVESLLKISRVAMDEEAKAGSRHHHDLGTTRRLW